MSSLPVFFFQIKMVSRCCNRAYIIGQSTVMWICVTLPHIQVLVTLKNRPELPSTSWNSQRICKRTSQAFSYGNNKNGRTLFSKAHICVHGAIRYYQKRKWGICQKTWWSKISRKGAQIDKGDKRDHKASGWSKGIFFGLRPASPRGGGAVVLG